MKSLSLTVGLEQTINFKLNWKKCDVQNYQKLVTDQITDMDLLSIIDCEEKIGERYYPLGIFLAV
jgi:predicted transcriptional regulator